MVLDKIENADLYRGLSDKITVGLNYIKNTDLEAMAPGKYDLSDGSFAIISEYNSKEPEDAKLEAHEDYLDIQYIIKGVELIGYTPLNKQTPTIPYNAEKDVVFYKEEVSLTKLEKGMFSIYFPTDLHQPCVKFIESSLVKKLVIKIPV